MFTLSDNQLALLHTARAVHEDGERRFHFWARREALRAAAEAFGQTLADSGLSHGQTLTDETRARLVRLAAELAPNPNLSRRLWTRNPADFDRRLRGLLFGQDALLDRVRDFLSVRGAGALTAAQMLCAFAPSQFPLVTRPALKRLHLSAAQKRDALVDAADRYGFPPATEPDAAQSLLALFCIYEQIKDVLGAASFADANDVLRQAWPVLPALSPAAIVREEGASYSMPAPARTEAALLNELEAGIAAQGFVFPPALVRSYYVSLKRARSPFCPGRVGNGQDAAGRTAG